MSQFEFTHLHKRTATCVNTFRESPCVTWSGGRGEKRECVGEWVSEWGREKYSSTLGPSVRPAGNLLRPELSTGYRQEWDRRTTNQFRTKRRDAVRSATKVISLQVEAVGLLRNASTFIINYTVPPPTALGGNDQSRSTSRQYMQQHTSVEGFPGSPACPSDDSSIKMERWGMTVTGGNQNLWKTSPRVFYAPQTLVEWPGIEPGSPC